MTRDAVCKEFGAWNSYTHEVPEEVHWKAAEDMADEILRLREQYAMTVRESAEIMSQREETSSQLWDCMNERDGLRSRLAAVEAERDKWEQEWDRVMKYWDASVARVTRAERILAALREPSEAIIDCMTLPLSLDHGRWNIAEALRAAVAAAEQEVQP